MTNIYIKSFNRPFYLDKCLKSILHYVKGDFQIIILDDGTAPEYLEKITDLYPLVNIIKSPFYENKVELIKAYSYKKDSDMPKMQIPSLFWSEQISKGSDYFLLLEDDMWLTDFIDINAVVADMTKFNINLVKLSLFGIKQFELYSGDDLSERMTRINPKIKHINSYLFKKIFVENKFYSWSVLSRLKLVSLKTFLPVFAIYAVAGCFYDKKFYNFIWNNYQGFVNENLQLLKVIQFQKKHPHSMYSHLKRSSIQTSYISSATNKFGNIDLDPFLFSKIMNEAWLDGILKTEISNTDFEATAIQQILETINMKGAYFEDWKLWSQRFKAQYEF